MYYTVIIIKQFILLTLKYVFHVYVEILCTKRGIWLDFSENFFKNNYYCTIIIIIIYVKSFYFITVPRRHIF